MSLEHSLNFRRSSIPIVRQCLDHYGHTAWPIALVQHFFKRNTLYLAGPLFDCQFNCLIRHKGCFCLFDSGSQKQNSDYEWIIDPLDGTKNYISGIPIFAVSIALRHHDQLQLGVVLDPVRNELFHAQRDEGAYLNGNRIQVSNRQNLEECLLATGFPFKQKEFLTLYVKCFQNIFQHSSGMRRMGVAAIDLAYVAAGRFDGFWELGLSPWDMAAGSLIIEEAGGKVSDFWDENSHLSSGYITATNGHIHHLMLQIIQRHFLRHYG